MRGEGPFCDPRCNDEAEERYREAVQEACVRSDRDENGMWQDPCDWSTVPDKPAKVEPVEGHYHCYFGAYPAAHLAIHQIRDYCAPALHSCEIEAFY